MATVEQAVAEGVLLRGVTVTQGTVEQPADGIDDDAGGQFTAGQDVVADRQFLVDLGLQQALVDRLVAAADQDQARQGGKAAHARLLQARALRTEVDHPCRLRRGGTCGGECRTQWLDGHDHAGAAAIGPVVDGAVRIGGVITRVPALELEQAALAGTANDAVAGAGIHGLGEKTQDINAHCHPPQPCRRRQGAAQKSASQSTRIMPAARSTARTYCPET